MLTDKHYQDTSQWRRCLSHQDLCDSCPALSGHVPGQFVAQKRRRFVVTRLHNMTCDSEFSRFRFFCPAPWPDKTAKGAYRICGASGSAKIRNPNLEIRNKSQVRKIRNTILSFLHLPAPDLPVSSASLRICRTAPFYAWFLPYFRIVNWTCPMEGNARFLRGIPATQYH